MKKCSLIFFICVLCFFYTSSFLYAELKNEADVYFSSDQIVKYIEGNPIGSFVFLAKKKVCISGKIKAIEEDSVVVDTGLIYGKILFNNISEETILNIDTGKIAYIVGSFSGYGLHESTIVFDNCIAYNEKPYILNNNKILNITEIISFYKTKTNVTMTTQASNMLSMLYKTAEGFIGDYYGDFIKKPNLENKNKFLKCAIDQIYSNPSNNTAIISYNHENFPLNIDAIKSKYLNNLTNLEETSSVSIESLLDEYKSNYKRALNKYNNKIVIINGKIKNIYGNIFCKKFSIELSVGWMGKFICHFYNNSFNSICNYKVGDSITISGIPINNESELSLYFCLIKDGEAESSISNVTEPNIENKKEENKPDQNIENKIENKINYGISIGDRVNVRKSPSKSSAIVCQINKNDKVEILDKQEVEEDFWYNINFEENKNVWVSSRFIETNISNLPNLPNLSNLPDENKTTNGIISGNRVNLRSDPSRNSKIFGIAMNGVRIKILEEKIIDNDVWYKIEYPEIGIVWIISKYVEKN